MEDECKVEVDSSLKLNESSEVIDINSHNNKPKTLNKIPFINKITKDESRTVSNPPSVNENQSEISEDEIDKLINKIGPKGKVKIEEKAKLDFDEDKRRTNVSGGKYEKGGNNNNIVQMFSKSNTNSTDKKTNFDSAQINKNNSQIAQNENSSNKKVNPPQVNNKPTDNNTGTISQPLNVIAPSTNGTVSLSNASKNSTPKKQNKNAIVKSNSIPIYKIIDPSVINKKTSICNSDILLCILELCLYSNDYGFKYKTKSKAFWEDICKKENYKNIFFSYKPETLKRYWSNLSEVKDGGKLLELINNYKEMIDHKDMKLLTAITNLVDCIKNKKPNSEFESSLSKIVTRNNKTVNFLGNKRGPDEELNQIEEIDLAKGLTRERRLSEESLLIDNAALEQLFMDEKKKPVLVVNENKEQQLVRNRVVFPNEKDRNYFSDIDEIVSKLNNCFRGKQPNEILDVLKKTSFNLSNAYAYLSDQEDFKYLIFSEMEDYILKNMRKSEYYLELVKNKGEELVHERERFLQIED